jgi:hypothetical protein
MPVTCMASRSEFFTRFDAGVGCEKVTSRRKRVGNFRRPATEASTFVTHPRPQTSGPISFGMVLRESAAAFSASLRMKRRLTLPRGWRILQLYYPLRDKAANWASRHRTAPQHHSHRTSVTTRGSNRDALSSWNQTGRPPFLGWPRRQRDRTDQD